MYYQIEVASKLKPFNSWMEDLYLDLPADASEPVLFAAAEIVVANFNRGEPSKKTHRFLWAIVELDDDHPLVGLRRHRWVKAGLVTQYSKGLGHYDTYECEICKARGKRFGLQSHISSDDVKLQNCPGESS